MVLMIPLNGFVAQKMKKFQVSIQLRKEIQTCLILRILHDNIIVTHQFVNFWLQVCRIQFDLFQVSQMKDKDKRSKLMDEILNGIKVTSWSPIDLESILLHFFLN